MSSLTLQQIFGDNAVQDADSITIAKSDLAQNTGFSAADENDGESVLTAVVLQAQALGLDTDHRDGNEDYDPNISQQVAVSSSSPNLITRPDVDGNILYFKRDSYTIDLDLPLPTTVNPGDY
ncbi:hypothetical protein [Nostoc sp. 'Peltigera membranacea cyanobiont' 232]|uniref:hypothetical protein n=1 Tax=Nostoc sp. 'Peltigera membranacea cyanobiont' 232 TaxID=2014531 RepID=UPI000B95A16F|nr:hypothetical protein [Nostoc sp. 'Peltigera membranacea cyanobiont' 232]OYE04748.1 hypothetical protein CDG79_11460 [Nostoc sp. 'Peltigera membranacea cyanobiont' 232]